MLPINHENCFICTQQILTQPARRQEVRYLTECNHAYHLECITAWANRVVSSCPRCWTNIVLHINADDLRHEQVYDDILSIPFTPHFPQNAMMRLREEMNALRAGSTRIARRSQRILDF